MSFKASRSDWLMRVPSIEPGGSLIIHPRDGLTRQQAFDAMIAMGYSVQGQIINGHARMGNYNVAEHGTALYVKRYWDEGPTPNYPRRPAKHEAEGRVTAGDRHE